SRAYRVCRAERRAARGRRSRRGALASHPPGFAWAARGRLHLGGPRGATRTRQLGGTSTATGTFVQINLNGSNSPGSGILTIGSGATFNDQTTSSGLNIVPSNFGVGAPGTTPCAT